MFDPEMLAEAIRSVAELHIRLLWSVAVFFQAGNTIPPFLAKTVANWTTPDAWMRWIDDIEDTFVPPVFASAYSALPELQNPYWETLVKSAFREAILRSAVLSYEADMKRYNESGVASTEPDYQQWRSRVVEGVEAG